ncbi:hybrid sensor histidine kinase/response regulator [Puteibacter caeruleilacunae]|nr:hybrid sensor histidine kinase/response regulator [Puteibacter caeruleilacunae]
MPRLEFLSTLLISFLSFNAVYAQEIEKYTVEDGLSVSEVLKISQDEQGFIYAATYNGLNVFNGSQFKQYNTANTPSLSNDIVCVLPLDQHITLIGSEENGLFALNKTYDEVVPLHLKTESGKVILPIKSMYKDSSGIVWIGTEHKGLYSFHSDSLDAKDLSRSIYCHRYSELLNVSISAICSSPDNIWIGTLKNGLYHVTSDNKGNTTVHKSKLNLSSENIWCLKSYSDTLYIGTENGLNVILPKTGQTKRILQKPKDPEYATNIIRAITRDRHNNIWIGTQEDGVYCLKKAGTSFDIKHFTSDPFNTTSLSTNKIISLYADMYDNIWIGTWNGGLNKYDLRSQSFKIVRNHQKANILSENMVKCIARKDKNSYWLGTYGSGICSYNRQQDSFKETISLKENNSVSALYKDDERNLLLVGSWGFGLKIFQTPSMKQIYQQLTDHPKLKHDRVYSIVKDTHGIYWLGTINNGVFSVNLNNGLTEIKHFPLSDSIEPTQQAKAEVRQIVLGDEPNRLVIVKHNYGIYEATTDSKGNILKISNLHDTVNFKDILSFSFFRFVFKDHANNMYIGTDNGLLYKAADSNRYSAILMGENINTWDMAEDDDHNLWIATYSGLIRYTPSTGTFNRFFPTTIFMKLYYDKVHEKMFSVSHSGLYEFNPSNITLDPYYPEIFFDHFQVQYLDVNPGDSINGKPLLQKHINYTKQLTLPYSSNTISMDINTLSFASPKKNKIQYQLNGFESIWHTRTAATTNINYRNIPPGNYTLQVKAANKDNIWNPSIRKINITVLPPWWKTTLAYLAYVILLFTVAYVMILKFNHRIASRQQKKIDAIKKEKEEELNEQKLRFFTNISHDLRTPLTLILGPLEDILSNEETGTRLNKQHKVMHKNASLLLRLVNQILDFRKVENKKLVLNPAKVDLIHMIKDIIGQFESAVWLKDIDITLNECDDTAYIWADQEQLEKVMMNLLSNAVKFTSTGGMITVNVRQKKDDVFIDITDDGSGIAPEDIPNIFQRYYQSSYSKSGGTGIGLALAQKIIELHNGSISVNSEEECGTTFTIQLPVGREFFQENTSSVKASESQPADLEDQQLNIHEKSGFDTLLVIDDNEDIREYLKDNLSSNYRVVLAENGNEGLLKAKQILPALIICDIMMDDIDGTEVCELLKKDINTSHIPIILLTSKTSEESTIEGFEKGADDYIYKPFSVKLLKTRIQNLILQRTHLRKQYAMLEFNSDDASLQQAPDEDFLTRAIKFIEENSSNKDLCVEDIAKSVEMTHDQYYRKIKSLTGLTANKFTRKVRLKAASNLLRTNRYNVSEVLYKVGFSSPSYFSKCFKEEFGMTPVEFLQDINKQQS